MEKLNKLHVKMIVISIITVLFSLQSIFSYSSNQVMNKELSGYQFIVQKEEDSKVKIIGDSSNLKEGVSIQKILDPDGNPMNLENVTYYVDKNGSYDFSIQFISMTGEHTENVTISVNTLVDKTRHNITANTRTIKELKIAKMISGKSTTPISIPMYIEGEDTVQGNYPFPGGNIEDIADQNFDGLPYTFLRAEISIQEGGTSKTYPISYYDEVDGIRWYALQNDDNPTQDFEVAYEVPAGATFSFIFTLNTQDYPVMMNNDNEADGFQVQYITGVKVNPDGTLIAKHNSLVKIELTYPLGYYTANAPAGKKNVGIEISDESLEVTKVENPRKRTIIYTFIYPDKPLTLDVVGDKDASSLMYGLYDSTGGFQSAEQGMNWWRATDEDGIYTKNQPYYGFDYIFDDRNDDYLKLKVRGGEPTEVKTDSLEEPISIAGGSFNRDEVLHFEYANLRVNMNSKPPYFYWPSPTMSLCYFPNGANINTDNPITETFLLWEPSYVFDPKDPNAPVIENTYTAENGAIITTTVKKSVYTEVETSTPGVKLNYINYLVHVKVENMKNSFYIRTQGASNVQGPHFFRDSQDISLAVGNGINDSYFLEDQKDENGGNTGTIGEAAIRHGAIFLDKRAVYNKNITNGGVPWKGQNDVFFKFGITPKWGYTKPRIESYDSSTTPIQINKPIELEKKELEVQSGSSYPNLALGNYSWFTDFEQRKEISPFQYVLFMPVDSLSAKHNMRAIDIKTEKITGLITNNTSFVRDGTLSNNIVEGDGTFDLLTKDKIVFNPNFVAPEVPDKVFVGFNATITAPDNSLLPTDYKVDFAKDIMNTTYFKPGDHMGISDFFRSGAAKLLDSWNENHSLTNEEQDRLNFIMYSSELKVNINLVYKDVSSEEGRMIRGLVNKYLQDVNTTSLTYATTSVDTKSIEVIKGTNILFSKYAETFMNPDDHYTYYLNEDNTTSVNTVTTDGEEIASVKYDRGLTVNYLNSDGSTFTGIEDDTVYKTYAGSNEATIKFPSVAQSPLGKVFDYWTVEEFDENGNWNLIPGLEITDAEIPATYTFSSGVDASNRSIRLKVVWKDISPDSYISIPKNIQLSEKGTNLTPDKDYAGGKVTISYQSVNGSDKTIYVDVLKNFELAMIGDATKKIRVSSYGADGNLLNLPGINSNYARIGEFKDGILSKNIWFNTPSQDGNSIYKKIFGISSDPTSITENILFYISAKTS